MKSVISRRYSSGQPNRKQSRLWLRDAKMYERLLTERKRPGDRSKRLEAPAPELNPQ